MCADIEQGDWMSIFEQFAKRSGVIQDLYTILLSVGLFDGINEVGHSVCASLTSLVLIIEFPR